MSGWREAFGSVSVHAGQDTDVRCHTYQDTTPILSLDSRRLSVSISIAGRAAPTEAVAFARELAVEAARFAAECERLHAAQHAQPPANTGAPSEGQAPVSDAKHAA